MNIRRNYFEGLIFLLMLCILFTSVELYPQKNKYGKYPGDKPIPNIHNFPPAIQRLDSIKSSYFKKREELEKTGEKYNFSKKFVEEFASNVISCHLYYSNFDGSGLTQDYFSIAEPMGLEILKCMVTLPYPWDFLLHRDGVVLVSVISDTIYSKKGSQYFDSDLNEFVMTAKVHDDIFNSVEEDTIIVRYKYSVSKSEIFKNNKDILLLFGVSYRSTMQRDPNDNYIYEMGVTWNKNYQYMFVINGVIKDPYNVTGNDGRNYYKFKDELLNFCREKGIRP